MPSLSGCSGSAVRRHRSPGPFLTTGKAPAIGTAPRSAGTDVLSWRAHHALVDDLRLQRRPVELPASVDGTSGAGRAIRRLDAHAGRCTGSSARAVEPRRALGIPPASQRRLRSASLAQRNAKAPRTTRDPRGSCAREVEVTWPCVPCVARSRRGTRGRPTRPFPECRSAPWVELRRWSPRRKGWRPPTARQA